MVDQSQTPDQSAKEPINGRHAARGGPTTSGPGAGTDAPSRRADSLSHRAASDPANPTYDNWCAPPRLQNAPQRWQSDRQNYIPQKHVPEHGAPTVALAPPAGAGPGPHYQLGQVSAQLPAFNRHDEHWRYSHEPRESGPAALRTHLPEPHGAGRWRTPQLARQGDHAERRGSRGRDERAVPYSGTYSGPYFGRGPKGVQRTDERLADEVAHRLAYNGNLDASAIEVGVKGGEVTLSGTVSHRYAKHIAEDEAERVFGVKDVHNRLRVAASLPESAGMITTRVDVRSERGAPANDMRRPADDPAAH